jgi:hypothetical protein
VERLIVLALVLAGYFWFARRQFAKRFDAHEAGTRAMANIPGLVVIVICCGLGDRFLTPADWRSADVTPGWLAGLVAGVLLSGPINRAVLRWYGLDEGETR